MSVLAHLAAPMGEPGATQALAYVLNKQPNIVQAFVKLLGVAGVTFDPKHRVESERGDDGGRISGRPDIKIFDAKGNLRVLVENKFWAGLTDAQPVDYLKMLPEDISSGLLFIVPTQRVEMLWKVLKTRCRDAGLDLGEDLLEGDRGRWVPVGSKRMLVTDWQNVLDTLVWAADDPAIKGDILQLRRLAETLENLQPFRALRSDEVTNVDLARRVINYIELIEAICTKLDADEADLTYGTARAGYYDQSFYRYLEWNNRDGQRDGAYLTLSFPMWRKSGGITPLWLWAKQSVQLSGNIDGTDVSGDDKYIPIRLKLGVERDRVVEDGVEQIRRMLT